MRGYDIGYIEAMDEVIKYCDFWIRLYESSEHGINDTSSIIPYICIRANAERSKKSRLKREITGEFIQSKRRKQRVNSRIF